MKKPNFETKEELFQWLKENKSLLLHSKKNEVKHGDLIPVIQVGGQNENKANKAEPSGDSLRVKVVINTTNVMDSHLDVHIPGLWNKSLKENKDIYLLQEHKMEYDNVIAYPSSVKASAESFNFSELGFKQLSGTTEALVFEAEISKEDNPDMFRRYAQGKVTNHSVGMRYVKILMAVNSDDEDFKEEKKNWDKYIDQVANRKDAENQGYFWAVTEAKVIEGSAVPIGSNRVTPTIETESKEEAGAGASHSDNREPSDDTHFNFMY